MAYQFEQMMEFGDASDVVEEADQIFNFNNTEDETNDTNNESDDENNS